MTRRSGSHATNQRAADSQATRADVPAPTTVNDFMAALFRALDEIPLRHKDAPMKIKPTDIHAEWVLFSVGCVFALLAAIAAVVTPPNNPACGILAGFAFVILVGAAMTGMANNP